MTSVREWQKCLLSCFFASPTLRAAFVRSSWLMNSLSSRMANMPASVTTLRRSAPLNPSESLTIASISISEALLTGLACILRISSRACSLGRGTSIFLSRRPGRRRAGSRVSGRFVAIISFVRPSASKPSIWFSSYSRLQHLNSKKTCRFTYFHQCSLNFTISTRTLWKPPTTNSINFIHEDDTWFMITGVAKHFTNDASRFTDILVNDSRWHDFEEVGLESSCNCSGEESFAGTWRTVEKNTLWWFDTNPLEKFWTVKRKFYNLFRWYELLVNRNRRSMQPRTSRSSRTCSPKPPIPAKEASPGSSMLIL